MTRFNLSLGFNLNSLYKIVKSVQAGDSLTMRAADSADTVTIIFESQNAERVSEYEMRLMDLDGDHLGIPDGALGETVFPGSIGVKGMAGLVG